MGDRVAVMNEGRLQQIDTPKALYASPANVFVAGFIGSPPMNFLRGALANNRFESEGLTFAADVNHHGEAVLGVRPEDCTLVAVAAADGHCRGRIYSVELIGDHSLVTLNVGDQQVVVKVSNMFTGEIGTEVGLHLNHERIYFFDQHSGKRIRQD